MTQGIPHVTINVLDRLPLAGFALISYGRFWVFTEDGKRGSGSSRLAPQLLQVQDLGQYPFD